MVFYISNSSSCNSSSSRSDNGIVEGRGAGGEVAGARGEAGEVRGRVVVEELVGEAVGGVVGEEVGVVIIKNHHHNIFFLMQQNHPCLRPEQGPPDGGIMELFINLAIEKCKKNVVRPVSLLITYLLFPYIKTLDSDQFTRDYQIKKISILLF